MDGTETVHPTDTKSGFNIYSALRHFGGKSYPGIHKVLLDQGLNIPINELRRCLTKATRAGLMKKTKRGYRLEIRVCDNFIKSLFQEFQGKELPPGDYLSIEKWYICGSGPTCHKHNVDENKVGRLRRGASLLSVLGGRLVRNLSFLRLRRNTSDTRVPDQDIPKRNVEETILKRPVDEQNDKEEAQSPYENPCSDQGGQQSVNHVLEDCWKGMTNFFRTLEETDLIKADMDISETP